MQCKEIIHTIEERYPVRFALEWDNVGLLVGRDDKEVKRIYIALDGTDEVIDEAVRQRADLLITHHPLIFGGMKRINNQDFTGKRILKLIQNDICCYAMHTNYDVCGMGYLAAQRMGMKNSEVGGGGGGGGWGGGGGGGGGSALSGFREKCYCAGAPKRCRCTCDRRYRAS